METDGITLVRASGPYVELYFDWQKLPILDLKREYYLVRFTPDRNCTTELGGASILLPQGKCSISIGTS